MENPIQYHNTDNPSQMGGVSHNKGGVNHNAFFVMISPPRAYHNDKCVMINPPGCTIMGGLMKTLHRQGH